MFTPNPYEGRDLQVAKRKLKKKNRSRAAGVKNTGSTRNTLTLGNTESAQSEVGPTDYRWIFPQIQNARGLRGSSFNRHSAFGIRHSPLDIWGLPMDSERPWMGWFMDSFVAKVLVLGPWTGGGGERNSAGRVCEALQSYHLVNRTIKCPS